MSKAKTSRHGCLKVLDKTSELASNDFQTALVLYRKQDWTAADNAFRRHLNVCPTDKAAKNYIARIATLTVSPPAKDWDGVWAFETK